MDTVLLASAVHQARAPGIWGRKEGMGGPALGLLGLLLWEGGRNADRGRWGIGHAGTGPWVSRAQPSWGSHCGRGLPDGSSGVLALEEEIT